MMGKRNTVTTEDASLNSIISALRRLSPGSLELVTPLVRQLANGQAGPFFVADSRLVAPGGSPRRESLVESFNGRIRQERLDESWLLSQEDAKEKIEAWRQ